MTSTVRFCWPGVLLILFAFTSNILEVEAVACGKWYSNDCLAEEDIRYDQSSSNNISEQDPIWNKASGFFRVVGQSYNAEGLPMQATPFDNATGIGWPYQQFPMYWFYNITTAGSRMYDHRYVIYPPAPQDFCGNQSNDSLLYSFAGVCGENGYAYFSDGFSTSSYEKDGSTTIFPYVHPLSETFRREPLAKGYPINENSFHITSDTNQAQSFFLAETFVCLDSPGCNQFSSVLSAYFQLGDNGTLPFLTESIRMTGTRVTEENFVSEILEAYETYNVPEEVRVEAPMKRPCLGGVCPSEEDWCTIDPNCSESPYQEPDGSVRAGTIAGLVTAIFVVILLALFAWHRYSLAKQANRYKAQFARRVAETIQLHGSRRQLTPEGLVKEFDLIDEDKGGTISKNELWIFISSGKAGEMSRADFNALFAAIDIDKNGSVDFLEFAAFMAQCNDQLEAVKDRKSVRDLAARRLSSANVPSQIFRESVKDEDLQDVPEVTEKVEETTDNFEN